ncbi:hypothetical protein GCM10010168_38320 [Actinoplanes ianthinogenes]|uniref:CU044_5270 family protein n=1 Tax=Actinoplanes ianthinogenes TaxID=122358 RepID=A0ABM7M4S4_9ACTN|nr:CU044_5270 family protein [Actinoplanes ianthinogenes]BCJ46645.1 hypothetical protein Aiant_73020 [Actinoplanes ianthinogenes]GGR16690.1 hypothetical protein GCM10010168_38320 [Actinoplanes ianthinogenes]
MDDLMTPPAGPELAEERKRVLKARLLNAIEEPAARRRPWRMLIPAAGVLAVTLAVGMTVVPWHRAPAPPYVKISNGDHDAAVSFLGQAAVAAGGRPEAAGGYLYVRSRTAYLAIDGKDRATMPEPSDREIWIPLVVGGHGLLRDGGKSRDLGPYRTIDIDPGLPETADAMLAKVYAEARKSDNQVDAEAFTLIGDYLEENATVLRPKVVAALYGAAARIPGVELLPDAEDAAGRHGVAVARVAGNGMTRREWIFDAATHEYLGERTYLIEDTEQGRAGMVIGMSAVLAKAVVGKAGDRP